MSCPLPQTSWVKYDAKLQQVLDTYDEKATDFKESYKNEIMKNTYEDGSSLTSAPTVSTANSSQCLPTSRDLYKPVILCHLFCFA